MNLALTSSLHGLPNLLVGQFVDVNGERMRLIRANWRPMTEAERVEWPGASENALLVEWELQPAHQPAPTERR